MPALKPEFRQAIEALNARGTRFVLIGGVAMALHGSAHITVDLDVAFACNPDNLAKITDALAPFAPRPRGFPEGLPFRWDVQTLRNAPNITLETTLCAVDLLAEVAGTDSFDGLWERAKRVDLDGLSVRVASIDDLISMKRAANRVKDHLHLLELLALKKLIEENGTNA